MFVQVVIERGVVHDQNTVLMCWIVTCFGSRWGMSQDLEKGTVLCVCPRQRSHLSLNGSLELPTGLQARQSRCLIEINGSLGSVWTLDSLSMKYSLTGLAGVLIYVV